VNPRVDGAKIQHGNEKDKQGRTIASWSQVRVADGRVLLEGPERFDYPNGKLMWSLDFDAGRKMGEEQYLRPDGTPIWKKHYAADGTWTWDTFDKTRKRTAESKWNGKTLLNTDVPDVPVVQKPADAKLPEPDGL
jgi:hypothetical protein